MTKLLNSGSRSQRRPVKDGLIGAGIATFVIVFPNFVPFVPFI